MDDLVKRADEALKDVTPGPWTVKYDSGNTCLLMGGDCQMCDMTYYPWTPDNDADWHFIAAARELVPAMRNRIEADAKRIAELEDSRNRLDDRIAELVEKNGQSCVRAETAEDRAEAAEARVKVLEDEIKRLRLAVKLAKSAADEWAISRKIGSPVIESEKAGALWRAIRRLSAISYGPIQGSTLEREK